MAGDVADMIDEAADQGPHLISSEAAIVGMLAVHEVTPIPFPIGRQHLDQARRLGAIVAERSDVGVGQRAVDIEADMPCAPAVRKADIEQVRGQRELDDDAGRIKKVGPVTGRIGREAAHEFLGAVIAREAELAALLRTDQAHRLCAVDLPQRGERGIVMR